MCVCAGVSVSVYKDQGRERDWKRKLPGAESALQLVFLPLACVQYNYSLRVVFQTPPTQYGRCSDTQRTLNFAKLQHLASTIACLTRIAFVPLLQSRD